MNHTRVFLLTWLLVSVMLAAGCGKPQDPPADYYGTLEPFAAEAVYFVVTDRFVDGDPDNNQVSQGGENRGTFDRPVTNDQGQTGNIGYLGGDFRGIANNAGYISDMGFTAVWLTPIVNNPDEHFTGGLKLGEGFFADNGKTGYHGYWGVNFFEIDEHLPSEGFAFAELTAHLKNEHGLKTVLDIVCNHGSPSYTMPEDQPLFGELYDGTGTLVADHQNLHPGELDDGNPLHDYFNREPDLAELSDLNGANPDVLDYFVSAYLQWIDQGADAFRVDTIRHMPHSYWKAFSDRIRAEHPGFFMFGESFDYDATKIAPHTYPENGAVSVLDFPGRKSITGIFEQSGTDFADLPGYLHLDDGIYQNSYELMSFYDNHDMPRMNAGANGFIDAHNWLFTARGIPVIYYGSEVAFRAGRPEHGGNRDYFGQQRIDAAPGNPVHAALTSVANIRRQSPALQRGLQANLEFGGDKAAFYRVFQHDGLNQTALVLLNKGNQPAAFEVNRWLSSGEWRDAATGQKFAVPGPDPRIGTTVGAHGVRVLLLDAPNNNAELAAQLERLQAGATRNP